MLAIEKEAGGVSSSSLRHEPIGIEVGGATQESAPTFIQRHGQVAGERVAFEHEALMLFQKQLASASWRKAMDLSLGTLRIGAQSAEIDIPCFPEEENVGLVVGDADSTPSIEIGEPAREGKLEPSAAIDVMVQAVDGAEEA